MNRRVTIIAESVLAAGSPPDVAFVPPLVRRRFSLRQKLFFALAQAVADEDEREIVFASRDGEDALSRRIVDEFHADGAVSPNRFSTSVYNAAPGLWSVFRRNRAAYTAIAAEDDTIECGLIEALGSVRLPIFVYAEETGGGYGASVNFSEEGGGRRIEVSNAAAGGSSIGFSALADFLSGRGSELNGRWLRLRDVE